MFSIAGEWLPLPGIRCRGQGLCRKRRLQPPVALRQVNRYFRGGGGEYGVAVVGDRLQRQLMETDALTRRSESCLALYCEG